MKIAVCTIAYNEEEWIGDCINQFRPFKLDHLVLLSTIPWNGQPVESDRTLNICKAKGAKVISGYWETEYEQRNYGLAYFYNYDYVLIVDADELYSRQDIENILKSLRGHKAYRVAKMETYWKNTDYVFEPPDKHKPVIAVDPKQCIFYEHRQIRQICDKTPYFEQPLIDTTLHHMSWAKSDKKIYEKINSFSHCEDIDINWYYDVWLKWKPKSDMMIRPYGIEKSKAIYKPLWKNKQQD
jgi:glycosyltransferase involved in cell wall biosynthesis